MTRLTRFLLSTVSVVTVYGIGQAFASSVAPAQSTALDQPTTLMYIATVLFSCAVVHTFLVKRFEKLAHRYPEGSVSENVFHLLAEVEVVFGFWAGILVIAFLAIDGPAATVHHIESLNYTEPAFVFVIMSMAATAPVLLAANRLIGGFAQLFPIKNSIAFYWAALVLGPLLGSFITEPAAMTVTALILLHRYYERSISTRLKYATIGVLFVNVSIGGTLTNFAAPPVLMVASTWGWGIEFMMTHFGWKCAIAVVINASAVTYIFRRELGRISDREDQPDTEMRIPFWMILVSLGFLAAVVATAHHLTVFMGIFLFFLGFVKATSEYQEELKLEESLLVGFFLAGLVTLGSLQQWWLQPVLTRLGDLPLFIGATCLTAITDNAALTFLGSLVEGISDSSKYALVAGAVAGGGLTVIANAPNPAGFGILRPAFGEDGISPLGLLVAAIGPTIVACICLWFLPSLG